MNLYSFINECKGSPSSFFWSKIHVKIHCVNKEFDELQEKII